MNDERRLHFIVEGMVHPFDAPDYPKTQIVAWQVEATPREALLAFTPPTGEFAETYTAYVWCGEGYSQAVWMPGQGWDFDPPQIAIA